MRLFVILMSLFGILAAFGVSACSSVATAHQNQIQPFDSTLRSELVRLGREDQAARDNFGAAAARNDTAYGRQLMASDSARTKRLREIVQTYGWPGRSLVGEDGATAAWLILQHSPSSEFQEALLPTLWAAADRGEMAKADVAMLTDRVLVHNGHPQRYGSQFSVQNKRLIPDSIEDLPGLEARRTAVGLPSMAEYVRMLSQMYGLPVTWPPAPTLHQAQAEPQPDLRAQIASRVAMDQAVQRELSDRIQAGQPIGPASARQDSVFNANLEWMRLVLAQYGWPGRRLVGDDGSHGAWLLLQHADRDTALQRTAMQLLESAVRENDASPRDLAYLTDRVRVAEGRLQVYGTQLQYDGRGCASPKPSEEPAQLDARRASVGLEPVAQYVHTVMAALGRATRCATPK